MTRIRLLGPPRVEFDAEPASGGEDAGEGRPRRQPRGRKSWAVLARVVLTERPVPRATLAAEIFADADDPLGALRWTLADLRRAIGEPALLRGDPLSWDKRLIRSDVQEFDEGTLETAAVGDVLLDGAEPEGCIDFEMWLVMVRARWAVRSLEELRTRALRALAHGDTEQAVHIAERAAGLAPLDDGAQELLLRALVADGRADLARTRLAVCEGAFAQQGLLVPPGLRAAAADRSAPVSVGLRAGAAARSLMRAGVAALAAGAADGGVETLRRAADDAARADDVELEAEVSSALGGALVHAVRGFDGEGAVVLHRALVLARAAGRRDVAAEALRELAFIDVQAGRHSSASDALRQAADEAAELGDPTVSAAILAVQGMNEADCGRHRTASDLLSRAAELAGERRQRIWSLGVLARSQLLAGDVAAAEATAADSIAGARSHRWNAFLPWPQSIHAECLVLSGRPDDALAEAEQAYALGCELGDPCWEGMAARMLSVLAMRAGDYDTARRWIVDARRRCDRVSDRYAWVSCNVGLVELELTARVEPDLVPMCADRLRADATRSDLPEFLGWALLHLAHRDRPETVRRAAIAVEGVHNPLLQARVDALLEEIA